MTNSFEAPVNIPIRYKVGRYKDEFSYQVLFDFTFTKDPEAIKDFLLVEMGVYTFKTFNEANIQAKRICGQFKEYFAKGTYDLIIEEVKREEMRGNKCL